MNTAKLNYEEESIDKAQTHILEELNTMLDLRLSQVLTEMYDTATTSDIVRKTHERIFDFGVLQSNTTDIEKAASMSNHPVSVYN